MATAIEFVLPEKYTDDLKDENGNPMSKRCVQAALLPLPLHPLRLGQLTHWVPNRAVSSRSARRLHRRPRRQQRRR